MMHRYFLRNMPLPILAALLASTSAYAETGPLSSAGEERAHLAAQHAPNDNSLGLTSIPKLELIANKDKQKVSLDWSLVSSASKRLPGTGIIKSNFDQFTLSASAELGEGSDNTELLNLKGFPNGTTVGLKWTHFWKQTDVGRDVTKILDSEYDTAVAICENHHNNSELSADALQKECSRANGGEGFVVNRYNPDGFRKAQRSLIKNPITPFIGLKIDGNQAKYKYLDAAAFAYTKKSKFSYEATAFVGGLFRDSPTIIKASFTLARKYEEQNTVSICQPTSIVGQTKCLSGADGAPTIEKQQTGTIELYRAFANDDLEFPQFAIAPSISYDFKNKGYEASLPIYFARNAEKRLSGGVRLGYLSALDTAGNRKGEFSMGLFVGIPLGF
jgi:hypothetical protein